MYWNKIETTLRLAIQSSPWTVKERIEKKILPFCFFLYKVASDINISISKIETIAQIVKNMRKQVNLSIVIKQMCSGISIRNLDLWKPDHWLFKCKNV